MIAPAYPVEDVVLERRVPADFFISHPQNNIYRLIFNNQDKRSYKSTESVMWANDMLSLGVEYLKALDLFNKIQKFVEIDFDFFKKTFEDSSCGMAKILPQNCLKTTDVSIQDECLYSFYEFENTKIFFNLFFEEANEVIFQLSINDNSGFSSIEGDFNQILDFLQNKLKTNGFTA